MRSLILAGVLLALCLWLIGANAQAVDFHWSSPVKDRVVTFYAEPRGKVPEEMAVLVESDEARAQLRKRQQEWNAAFRTNRDVLRIKPFPFGTQESRPDFKRAVWVPFKTNVTVDLGAGDGARWLWISFKNGTSKDRRWSAHLIIVQSSPPHLQITYPKGPIISQPMILLKGYSPVPLKSIWYDVLNQNGEVTTAKGQGLVNDQYYDPILGYFTTNYFTCYYIKLDPGSNTLTLHCADFAGNETVTNLTYDLDLAQDKTPPVISVDWPRSGMEIPAGPETVRGKLDDATERVVARISANGQSRTVEGEVEWSHFIDGAGYFWIERLPVSVGTNRITLTVRDAAGNSSRTNLMIMGTAGPAITMDPVLPADKLWEPYLDITGTVRSANHQVWINGVQAVVKPDGTWLAKHVPVVSPNVGTACFDMTSVPPGRTGSELQKLDELVSVQTDLATNEITLNSSMPVCGTFQLHLNNVAGRKFILLASTNLVEWTPVLTNLNPSATFDYRDSNANNYHCRFFRIIPLP